MVGIPLVVAALIATWAVVMCGWLVLAVRHAVSGGWSG